MAAAAILIAGAAVRCFLMPLDGHKGDLALFWQWSAAVKQDGMAETYRRGRLPKDDPRHVEPCNYPPLYLYCLAATGAVAERTGLIDSFTVPARFNVCKHPALLFVLKTPALIADMAACCLLFWYWKKRGRPGAGLGAMAAYAFFPPVLYDGAAWGQSDTILAALLLVVAIAATARRGWLAGAGIAAAVLLKPQGVLAVPIWLAIALAGRADATNKRRLGAFVAATCASGVLMTGLIVWPTVRDGGARQLARVYTHSVGSHTSVTVLAFNAWYVWAGPDHFRADVRRRADDRTLLVGPVSYRHVGLASFAVACLVVLSIAARSRPGPEQAPVLAFAIAWSFFMLNTEMHERYGIPSLVFMAMAVPLGTRFVIMYALLAMTNLWNLGIVYQYPSKVLGRWLPDFLTAPYSWRYGELIFGLSAINCVVLVWCVVYLGAGAKEERGGGGESPPSHPRADGEVGQGR